MNLVNRNTILGLPKKLTTLKTNNCTFGAQAFTDWADDIENGRFDNIIPEKFNQWKGVIALNVIMDGVLKAPLSCFASSEVKI